MKIESKGGPNIPNPGPATVTETPRDRAIAALMQGQQAPVQNPNQVAPEELGAIRSKGQTNTSESQPQSDQGLANDAPAQVVDKTKEELLSTQYAQLARREKAIVAKAQAQERALRQREAEIAAREDAIKAKESDYQSNYIPKNRLANETIDVLLENGISYDQITQLALAQTQQDPATRVAIQQLQQKLQQQEEALKSRDKQFEEQQSQAYQQAVKQIKADARQLVMADPQYEAIRKTNSLNDVVELIEETFKEDGIILSVEEACREVEDHLVEKLSSYSSQISKIQRRMRPDASSKPAPTQSGQQGQKQPTPTLTNAQGTGRKLSARERALLAFEGKLQK